jgi:hypothetical protein
VLHLQQARSQDSMGRGRARHYRGKPRRQYRK